MIRTEGFFHGRDAAELFYQTWSQPDPAPTTRRPVILITHGIAEHSEAYDRFATDMSARGYDLIGWDLRGHGRSSGKRGYVADFSNYSKDLTDFVGFLRAEGRLAAPYFLFGHSMGGLVTLRCAADGGAAGATALCLSAPLLGIAMRVPPIKDLAARMLNRIWPTVTLATEIQYDLLTHDKALADSYRADPLRHEKASPALYLGMLENIAYVEARAHELRLPTLMQVAGQDAIVSTPAAEAWFATIPAIPKKKIVYAKSYHEIFCDLERDQALTDLDAFARLALSEAP